MSDAVPTKKSHATLRLARALNRLAGAIHPPRAQEWSADIAFLQSLAARETGLTEAWSHLAAAPRLTCRAAIVRVLRLRSASDAGLPRAVALSPEALASRRFVQPDFCDWVRGLTAGAASRPDIAHAVYTVGNCFAGDPQHVTFVRETDGSLRGLEIMGAEHPAVAVSFDFFDRHRERLGRHGGSFTVLLEAELLALQALAECASVHFPGYGDNPEEVVAEIAFISGGPL